MSGGDIKIGVDHFCPALGGLQYFFDLRNRPAGEKTVHDNQIKPPWFYIFDENGVAIYEQWFFKKVFNS